jgi:thiamine pyrophosphate-dependent acetolactate synthase large subunit-like protein
MLLSVHEESAVAIAHGWAKVTGKPMVVALHSNVGLMHATMAIFNAWCDRVPMLLIGAQGPLDAVKRRPWVDWLHTARDLGALLRGYTKWDDQPGSVGAAVESLLRANIITQTAPCAPVYVCLDAELQEQSLETGLGGELESPEIARFRPAPTPPPARETVVSAIRLLAEAARPVILMGRVSRDPAQWQARIRLAEALGACVITDLRCGASFPTKHRLHPYPPGLYLDEGAVAAIAEADVVLSLDWIDLAGTLRRARGAQKNQAKIIHCSVDQYCHNGWSMDHLGLPAVDLMMLSTPDAAIPALLAELTDRPQTPRRSWDFPDPVAAPSAAAGAAALDGNLFAEIVTQALASHRPSYLRLSIGWPGRLCDFDDPLAYLGFDGGGGIGSGPGMAVGAALALRGTDRLPVAVLGDGDFVMGHTALWTAVHYGIPLLVIIANNGSFYNDEVHQELVAKARNRPVENRWIGMRMSDPPFDLAGLARAQGVDAIGPATTAAELAAAIGTAAAKVAAGATCLVEARLAAGYDRTVAAGTSATQASRSRKRK